MMMMMMMMMIMMMIAQCALNDHEIQDHDMKYKSIVLGFPREAVLIGLLPAAASSELYYQY